jgi:stringent starvation protein B
MKKDEIVLNLSLETYRQMNLGNVWINFRARFGWIQRKIMVAVSHVFAIYS